MINSVKNINCTPLKNILFEIIIAAQFLKIIVKEIEAFKTAYKVRNISYKSKYISQEILLIYWLMIKKLILNIHRNAFNIANTLYSREINHINFIIDYQ